MIAGLTGGIGSGKSVVALLLETFGCAVFNSDLVAKEIYFDPRVKPKVVDLLGPQAYLTPTKIDKGYISREIFSNTHLLHQLNSIIHPAVKENFSLFVKENAGRIIVKETALLFEAGLAKDVDKIILVVSDRQLKIKRVMQRDGLTEEEVLKKMKSQLPQEEKMKKADFIIYNNEEEFLITQTLDIYKKLATGKEPLS